VRNKASNEPPAKLHYIEIVIGTWEGWKNRGISNSKGLSEGSLQLLESDIEGFRQHPAFSDDTHEVSVPDPTRNNVKVQVVFYTCAGALAEVHPQVKPVGMIITLNGELALTGKIHHLGYLSGRTIRVIGQMLIWTYQQVTSRIGKYVEDNEIMLPAEEDEFFFVVLHRFTNTKHACAGVPDISDVLISPWTPQVIHAKWWC
jgi:hypothetical protein